MLKLEAVSKRYERPSGSKLALDRVSLSVERGQMTGVLGPSGAGKSTLLRIAAGMERPDAGTVSFNGQRLDQTSPKELRRLRRREVGCAWTTQAWPEGLSVVEHVELPLLVDRRDRRVARQMARKLLLVCEAEQCADMAVDELSDGERQRVGIARALVTEPRLLLADGPASHLATSEQERIMLLLESVASEAEVAVLVTGSDEGALLHADPVLYLNDGRLLAPAEKVGKLYSLTAARSSRAAADA